MKFLYAALACASALTAPAVAAEKCTASADGVWAAAGKTIQAFASGDSCEKATAILAILDENGIIDYSSVGQTHLTLGLGEKKTPTELSAALAEWIKAEPSTAADLPEWKQGAEMPMQGEFMFYPADGIDRDAYEKYRAAKAPTFCFVPGIESLYCVVKDPDSSAIFPLGAQTFPG